VTVEYLSIGQLLALHAQQLRRYGGGTGVRDRGALESALARPAATFGGEDLYPDIADKAAALMHSLALNHPFVDGNKRVAAFGAIVFAESNGHEFLATPDELVETTLAVAEGKMAVEALAIWFRQRLRSVE
jgi:death-on-curing protein